LKEVCFSKMAAATTAELSAGLAAAVVAADLVSELDVVVVDDAASALF
jgi:hypothetical protein